MDSESSYDGSSSDEESKKLEMEEPQTAKVVRKEQPLEVNKGVK